MVDKVCALLSGGLDAYASALKFQELGPGWLTEAMYVHWGVPVCKKEYQKATIQAKLLGIPIHTVQVDMPIWLSDNEVDYVDDMLPRYYIPHRNLVFATLVASHTFKRGIDGLILGCHIRDSHCPDGSPSFTAHLEYVLTAGSGRTYTVIAPFMFLTKQDIVEYANFCDPNFLRHSWSCYHAGERPCGSCASCRELEEALHAASIDTRRMPFECANETPPS